MKKFITVFAVLAFAIGSTFAQEGSRPKAGAAPAPKTVSKNTGKEAKKSDVSKEVKETPASSDQHLKKDGTPDKRYKENKEAKPADAGAKKEAPAKTNNSKVAPDKGTKTAPKK